MGHLLCQLALLLLVLPCRSFRQVVLSHSRLSKKNQSTKLLSNPSSENSKNFRAMLQCGDVAKEAFNGKSILLTGASGGLGRALALQLAHCQAGLLVLSGRNEDSLKEVGRACQQISENTKVHVITCDLSDRESVQNLAKAAQSVCHTIDILINNGGVSSRSNFVDTDLAVDERVMQINFFAGGKLCSSSFSFIDSHVLMIHLLFFLIRDSLFGQSFGPKYDQKQEWQHYLDKFSSRSSRYTIENKLCCFKVCGARIL